VIIPSQPCSRCQIQAPWVDSFDQESRQRSVHRIRKISLERTQTERGPPQKKPQFLDQAHRIAPGKRIRPPGTLGTRRGRDRNGTSPPRARKPPLREIGPHPLPLLASAAGAAGGLETIEACGIGSGRIRRSNRGEDRGGSPRILIFLSLSLIFSPSPPSAPRLLCAGGGEGRGAEEERALPLFLSLSLAGRG
jgi:hypothetical protein